MNQNLIKFLKIIFTILFLMVYKTNVVAMNPTANAQQMVLTISQDWSTTTGFLQCFERSSLAAEWRKVGDLIPVSFGQKGLGWGIGLHGAALGSGPQVVEGARRSPSGVFSLNLAFGRDTKEELGCKLDYIKLKNTHFAPDDVNHPRYYNRIVDTEKVTKDWDSAEDMYDYMQQGVYAYGVVIEHNYENPISGKGSNFFIHVHRRPGSPTCGCTAFAADKVREVVCWLDKSKHPVLVQLPKDVFEQFKNQWLLPSI